MKCKCQICKAVLDTKMAYKITDKKGKNKYYCSEMEYFNYSNEKRRSKEDKDAVYIILCNIFGYKIKNTALFKEWKEWQEIKPNKDIAQFLKANEIYLTDAIANLSSPEYAKIRYLSTVINNSLCDFHATKPAEVIRSEVTMEMFNTSHPVINKRRSLADLEDEI